MEINEKRNALNKSLQDEGCDLFLTGILKWHSLKHRNKHSHFEVFRGMGTFVIYDSENVETVNWNLTFMSLSNQSDELINFLYGLI